MITYYKHTRCYSFPSVLHFISLRFRYFPVNQLKLQLSELFGINLHALCQSKSRTFFMHVIAPGKKSNFLNTLTIYIAKATGK